MIINSTFFHLVLYSNGHDPLIYAIVGFFIGLFLFYMGFKDLLLKRTMQNTPTSKIRSMAMGLVEIKGKALSRVELVSPLNKKKCVYYQWKIEKYVSSKNGGHWVKIGGSESSNPFYIEDDSGRAIVFPRGSELRLKTDMQLKCGSSSIKPEWKVFLDSQNIKYKGFFGGNRLKITEIYVEPEDKLYILGSAHFWRSLNSNEAELSMVNNKQKELIEKMKKEDSKCHASIRKGKNSKYYLISDSSEKELISSLGWKVPAMLFGGPILSVISLAYILYRFHSL